MLAAGAESAWSALFPRVQKAVIAYWSRREPNLLICREAGPREKVGKSQQQVPNTRETETEGPETNPRAEVGLQARV